MTNLPHAFAYPTDFNLFCYWGQERRVLKLMKNDQFFSIFSRSGHFPQIFAYLRFMLFFLYSSLLLIHVWYLFIYSLLISLCHLLIFFNRTILVLHIGIDITNAETLLIVFFSKLSNYENIGKVYKLQRLSFPLR